jgi:hypothetical protein
MIGFNTEFHEWFRPNTPFGEKHLFRRHAQLGDDAAF